MINPATYLPRSHKKHALYMSLDEQPPHDTPIAEIDLEYATFLAFADVEHLNAVTYDMRKQHPLELKLAVELIDGELQRVASDPMATHLEWRAGATYATLYHRRNWYAAEHAIITRPQKS